MRGEGVFECGLDVARVGAGELESVEGGEGGAVAVDARAVVAVGDPELEAAGGGVGDDVDGGHGGWRCA